MFVGRDQTVVTRDLRTLIYFLNLELREECSRTLGWNPAGAASGCMQLGSSSRSGCNRGAAAAAEAGAIGEQQLEADANGEQQLKRMQAGQGAAAAADSKRTQGASSS